MNGIQTQGENIAGIKKKNFNKSSCLNLVYLRQWRRKGIIQCKLKLLVMFLL